MDQSRRRWRQVLALASAGGLIWLGLAWWTGRRDRRAFLEIKSEMTKAHYGIAVRRLTELLAQRSSADEATYLLGICEERRGRNEAAMKAWARVAPGSSTSRQAIQARMQLAEDNGRFADVERLIMGAAEDPRDDGPELRAMLVPLYSQLGRIDEAERLVESRWDQLNAAGKAALELAVFNLRLHIVLTLKPNSAENIRTYLDHAARLAPEDDRVWLGRANLAIRSGDRDEAKRWLDACLERRPDDVPVWRARLSWGMAANRIDVVRQAMTRLQAAESTPAQLLRLSAWLSSQEGSIESERRVLQRLVAIDPGDLTALLRLARLEEKDGQTALAAQLGRKKAEIERLLARYERLYDRKQPVRDAVEMAQLAEQLGRTFEARAFLALAILEDPERDDLRRDLARVTPVATPVAARHQTLAQALAPELGGDGTRRPVQVDADGASK
jgi:enediyne biosynthesis protein E4